MDIRDDVQGDGVSPDGNGADDSSSGSTGTQKTVPYERFKQVNDKMNALDSEIKTLKEQKGDSGLTPEQQKELQAKQYLKSLLKETLTEDEKAKKEAKTRELEKTKQEVDDVLTANPEVKRSEFSKFLEKEGDDYSSVSSAFKGFQRLQETAKEAADKAAKDKDKKKNAALPGSEGSGEGAATFGNPPKDDAGKSIFQIAADALRGRK